MRRYNESSEIMRDLNAAFNDFSTKPKLDLYPEDMVGCAQGTPVQYEQTARGMSKQTV